MKTITWLFVLCIQVALTVSTCTFPAAFQNVWVTSSRGTWTVNSTTISNIRINTQVNSPYYELYNMDCYLEYNGQYVIKSQEIFKPFTTISTNIYMCIYLSETSAYNYVYGFGTTKFAVGTVTERLLLKDTSIASVTGAEVCTDTAYTTTPDRLHVALQNGSETSGKITCPDLMHGAYTYSGTSCSSNNVDICTDTGKITMNTTECSEKTMYSQNGNLDCVYKSIIDTNTYVIVYNEDTSPDGSTYYQFSCMALSQVGLLVYVSVRPEQCESTQVSTTAPGSGYITVFTEDTSYTTTTPGAAEDLTWLYVLIALLVIAIIVALIIIIICMLKRRRRGKDEESGDDDDDDSVDTKSTGCSSDKENLSDKDDTRPGTSKKEEEDRTSVDSGFIPDKDEPRVKSQTVIVMAEGDQDPGDNDRPGTSISQHGGPSPKADELHVENENDDDKKETQSQKEDNETDKMEVDNDETPIKDEGDTKDEDKEGEASDREQTESERAQSGAETESENAGQDEGSAEEDDEDEDDNNESGDDDNNESRDDDDDENDDDVTSENGTKAPKRVDVEKKEELENQENEERVDGRSSASSYEDILDSEGRKIKKKKNRKFFSPTGFLSKVLVTRQMEEKAREKRSKKKGGVKKFFVARKSKRGVMSLETNEDDPDNPDNILQKNKTNVVPFIEQYYTKKELERKLDEEHYWSEEEEKDKFDFRFDDLDETLESGDEEGRKGNRNIDLKIDEPMTVLPVDDNEDKKHNTDDSDSDDDIDLTNELPEGFARNEDGRITRQSDGHVFTDQEFKDHVKTAKLKRLFNVPRLNRNKKGRPIGGLKDDDYGPKPELETNADEDQQKNQLTESEERLSRQLRRLESKPKSVGFNIQDEYNDVMSDAGTTNGSRKSSLADASAAIRDKLRNRLFRKKNKRKGMHDGDGSMSNGKVILVSGADEDKPRELNGLVKVYGRQSMTPGTAPRSTLPPIGVSRTNSMVVDQYQLQAYRDGLSKDKEILNNLPVLPPVGAKRQKVQQLQVKEAFGDVTMDDLSDEDMENDSQIDIGNEDEFVLVGGQQTQNQNSNERLFTRVRGPPPMMDVQRSLGKNGGYFRHDHDRRHVIPWSMVKRPPTNDQLSRSVDGPHSADNANRRDMDEKRLRELLEELYKDKKYFDHVIDTTEQPTIDANIDETHLARHGRNYLLERAEFWDERGPIPPRPPPTSLGMRISRMQTTMGSDSGRVSMISTISPPIIEQPNQIPLRHELTDLPIIEQSDSPVPIRQENTFS